MNGARPASRRSSLLGSTNVGRMPNPIPSAPMPVSPVASVNANGKRHGSDGRNPKASASTAQAPSLKNSAGAIDLIKLASTKPAVSSTQCQAYAEILLQAGELKAAWDLAKIALDKNSSNAAAWDTLGSAEFRQNKLEDACVSYKKALFLEPGLASSTNNIAMTLERLGKYEEAETYYRELSSHPSCSAQIQTNFAALLGKLGKYEEGLAILQAVLANNAKFVPAYTIASALLTTINRYSESLTYIERAIALAPQLANLRIRKADVLRQLGRGKEAICECDEILATNPNDADALHERALILRSLDQPVRALSDLERLQPISKTPALIASDRGWLLAELGRSEEALDAFREALKIQPDLGASWYGYCVLRSRNDAAADIPVMENILSNMQMPHRDRIHFAFALGRSYLDVGNGAKAFEYLDMGNDLKRSMLNYDWRSDAAYLEKMSTAFPRGADWQRSDNASGMPFFVFGMPRSGTTLVEQILCSHPAVGSIGESAMIGDLAKGVAAARPDFYQGARIETQTLDRLGQLYLEHAKAITPDKPHFVDKMPNNFLHLGLISCLFPEARMIHCRRNPLDTCLSCYSTLFTHGHEYSYDQEDLGHYYSLYRDLMAYWREVLPADRILEVDYEKLVDDSENQVRRILDFCGLSWDPMCLRFYETKRHIKTASLNQVRSPIYKTSVGRSEKYCPWLGRLEAVLDRK
jgi:tetratricopeptide (TPR) repeat protein